MAAERVGELVLKDNGNLQFRYDTSYGGPPIPHALPNQHEAHAHAVAKAVFGGLLPEADLREAVARSLGISVSNDYARSRCRHLGTLSRSRMRCPARRAGR